MVLDYTQIDEDKSLSFDLEIWASDKIIGVFLVIFDKNV